MSSEIEMVARVDRTTRGRLRSIAPTCETVFAALDVYRDADPRSAAMNMAVDEALLESAEVPTIRFYHWDSPALSFGYFGRFADVILQSRERDVVRRWTGGGIVFHGEDLTYAIVIPANDRAFGESSSSLYMRIHRALREALSSGEISPVAALYERRTNSGSNRATANSNNATVLSASLKTGLDRRYSECFANPVLGDLMLKGRKVAGAAQRRTRRGLLHQGSIQHVDFTNGLAERFAGVLSLKCQRREINSELLQRAEEIAAQKYATPAWLRKR